MMAVFKEFMVIVCSFNQETDTRIDVHYNNGEPEHSKWKNYPDQDGALCFLMDHRSEWIYIKFASQTL